MYEHLEHVLKFLEFNELIAFGQTCRELRAAVSGIKISVQHYFHDLTNINPLLDTSLYLTVLNYYKSASEKTALLFTINSKYVEYRIRSEKQPYMLATGGSKIHVLLCYDRVYLQCDRISFIFSENGGIRTGKCLCYTCCTPDETRLTDAYFINNVENDSPGLLLAKYARCLKITDKK